MERSTSQPRRRLRLGSSAAVAGVLALGVAVAGCGSSSDSSSTSSGSAAASTDESSAPPTQHIDVLLPFPPGVQYVSGNMALDRFFAEEGLDVSFKPVEGTAIQQLIAGKADYAVCCTASVLIAASRGAELRGISVVLHDAAARLSVLEDSPIQSLAELKGENVGVSSLSDGSVPVVTAALNDAGLEVGSDVNLVVVGEGGPAVANALKSGRIAAYSAGASDQPGLITGGNVQLRSLMPDKYANLPDTVVVTTKEALDDPAKRETAIKLARALLKGGAYGAAHPDEAEAAGCKLYPDQCQNKEFVKVAVEKGNESNAPLPGKPGYIDLSKVQVYADALTSAGQLAKPVDISQIFTNEYNDEISKDVPPTTESG
jgi:NitT/TauT family transport system substrate-binding protein